MTNVTKPSAIAALKAQLAGPLLLPGDPGHDEEIAGFNIAITRRPTFVVGVATSEDIQATARYAAANDLPIGVHASGHRARSTLLTLIRSR